MKRDIGLDVLLELYGTEYTEENGFWYKIEAWLVDPTPEIPHGLRYNLTLHNHQNHRIMGFDNAHAVKPKRKGLYRGRIIEYDHVHELSGDKSAPYEFNSAEQLLKDFLNRVNQILEETNQR